jgi:hypothetical protein
MCVIWSLYRTVRAVFDVQYTQTLFYALVTFMKSGRKSTKLGYPAWPVQLYLTFPNYLIKGTIFGEKKVFKHKIVF